jgi:histidinol-phosphatase (PHP family)
MAANMNDSPGIPDYHMHTPLCKHAVGETSEYRLAAQAREIPEICFADHGPNPDGYDPKNRMSMEQFVSYRNSVDQLQDGEAPNVLLGIEADYYEGCETFLKKWLPAQRFDFVLGSVHYIGDWGFDNPVLRDLWETVDVKAVWKKYFHLIEKLVDSGLYDAIGHLDLPKKFGYRPSDEELKELAQPLLDRISSAGIGIEVNTSGLRKPVGEIYPSPMLISMAHTREIPICFGSDAHKPEEVGADFSLALKVVRETGYTHFFRIRKRVKQLTLLPGPMSERANTRSRGKNEGR